MGKIIIKVFSYYGKHEGESLSNTYVIEDTKENREQVTQDYYIDSDFETETQSFINKETNELYIDNYGGDWDDPTSYQFIAQTKDEVLEELKQRYDKEVKDIIDRFNN